MKSRLTKRLLVIVVLGLGACTSDNDPVIVSKAKEGVAGASGHAGQAGTSHAGASSIDFGTAGTSHSQLPGLGFAGTGTGRDAFGACPTPPGQVCTGSPMDYFFCVSAQCATVYAECYGTNGYCLSTIGCISGCTCGDVGCEQGCFPKDCLECLDRMNQCAAASTCVPATCTMQGAAGAPGVDGQGGAAGQTPHDGSAGVAGGIASLPQAGSAGAP